MRRKNDWYIIKSIINLCWYSGGFNLSTDKGTALNPLGLGKVTEAYLQEAKKWEEGGAYKLLLHGALGSVLSGMSGQGVSSGMLSATSNEALQTSLANIQDPELHKLASFVIGRTLGHDVGGAVSSIATEENWLNHYDQMALLADIINYK